jgi:hypothetical protein
MHLGNMECRPNADSCTITERRPTTGVSLKDQAELGRVKIQPANSDPRVDMYVLTSAKISSQGGIGFFWDLIPAEFTLRALMSVFPQGAHATSDPAALATGMLLNRTYPTVISTLDEETARSRGFFIPGPEWRIPRP